MLLSSITVSKILSITSCHVAAYSWMTCHCMARLKCAVANSKYTRANCEVILNDDFVVKNWGRLTIWQTWWLSALSFAISQALLEYKLFLYKYCDTVFQWLTAVRNKMLLWSSTLSCRYRAPPSLSHFLRMLRQNYLQRAPNYCILCRQTLGTTYILEFTYLYYTTGARGGVVVKALRYKPAGRGFDSQWCHWNFSAK
jgi:hypothetical protein